MNRNRTPEVLSEILKFISVVNLILIFKVFLRISFYFSVINNPKILFKKQMICLQRRQNLEKYFEVPVDKTSRRSILKYKDFLTEQLS